MERPKLTFYQGSVLLQDILHEFLTFINWNCEKHSNLSAGVGAEYDTCSFRGYNIL